MLDKTGTITEGKPRVTDVRLAAGVAERELARVAVALERKSEHPLAQAVCDFVDESHAGADKGVGAADFQQVAGGGVRATIDGVPAIAGNARLMASAGVDVSALAAEADELAAQAKTPLFFALGGRALGLLGVADVVKETSASAVARLRRMGVRTIMLTGDQAKTAEAVARQVGVDEVVAGVLPSQKEQKVRELQGQGHKVAMVGDGINDAPALARADVGIAIGAGTDVAISSADVVLMHSDPADVATAIELSHATMRDIRQNLFWALFYNAICIPVAMGVLSPLGVTLNPMVGAAAMGFSSVFVVSNALRLFAWKPSQASKDDAAPVDTKVIPAVAEYDAAGTAEVKDAAASLAAAKERSVAMEKKLNVEGMMCDHCVAHVTKALEGVPGVSSVKVSLADKDAVVEASPEVTDEALVSAVKEAGYEATVA